MKSPLGPKAAMLQALYQGPGSCPDLIERLRRSLNGELRLRQGPASLALRALERQGLVRGWTPSGGRRRGRPRRYFELTGRGIAEATSQRTALRGVLGQPTGGEGPSPRELRAMSERLASALALSDFAITLRDAPRRPL